MSRQRRFMALVIILMVTLTWPSTPALAGSNHPSQVPSQTHSGAGISLRDSPGWQPTPVPLMYDPNPIPNRVEALRPAGLVPQSSTFVIDYVPAGNKNGLDDTCLAFPEQAKAAFNDAGAKWGALLNSPITIRIEACWADLPTNVLGHSAALDYKYNFSGAPQANTWFPVALANALAGQDLDPPSSSCPVVSNCDDISIAYGNAFTSYFYYGTDGNTQGKTDFESVVMHEMGHGLGFSGSMRATLSGSIWTGNWADPYPVMYDRFAIDNAGNNLINTSIYPRNSTSLGSLLTSGNVFLNGPNARAANCNAPVPLYTPSIWAGGSSYAHLAESYNGTPNAMMTYSIGYNEVLHDPGPVVLGVFKDSGWTIPSFTLPSTPSNLSTAVISSSQINLSWTDNSTNESSFKIQQAGNDLNWASAGTAAVVPGIGGSGTFSTTNLAEVTPYNYRVYAANASGCSTYTNTATATTLAAAPTNLTASVISATQINLSWTDNSTKETAFTVQRAGSNLIYTDVGTAAVVTGSGGAGTFSSTGLSEVTPYNYRVCASNGSVCSSYTNTANATTLPAAPTGLSAPGISTSQIQITWVDQSAHETGFKIKRSENGSSNWVSLTHGTASSGTGGTVSFIDSGLTEGAHYFYSVCTQVINACSVQATIQGASLLNAPTLISAAPVAWNRIDVSWSDNSTQETGYEIQRSGNGVDGWMTVGTYSIGAGASIGPRTFQDGIPARGQIFYRVRAVTPLAHSTWLSGASADPIPAPFSSFVPQINR